LKVTSWESPKHYLSPDEAKRFYDRLGSRQDWQRFYEKPAIEKLSAQAAFNSAHGVFEFGCGTGTFAACLLQHYLPADARYVGMDVSGTMVSLALRRLKPWSGRSRVYQSNGFPCIAEPDHVFDRFVSNYVLDLLEPHYIEQLLSEAHRLLGPDGRLCLVSGTHGTSRFSRAVCWGWQRLWSFNPSLVGGCRPIELLDYLPSKDWKLDHRVVSTSWGITSEVLVASPR
jgi:ubiquinone/menaquinone biosynthesis C-methylase UbiE